MEKTIHKLYTAAEYCCEFVGEKNNCHYSVEMEKKIHRLYTAAEWGNYAALPSESQILQQDCIFFMPIPPGAYTALHIAAYHGHETFVEKLLALYANRGSLGLEISHNFLKVRDAYTKNTALHDAVRGGDHAVIVKLLVAADPTLANDHNNDSETPLFIAAENGHLNAVKELLKATHPPYERSDGRTPLHQAIYRKHYDVAKELSTNHELVNAEDIEGRTVLHVAALLHGCPEDIVEQLLEHDVSLCYKKDKINQRTALHIAATRGNLGFVKCILRIARRSAEIVDKDGRHALHLAVENGDVNTVIELLKSMSRRSLEIVDKDGRHALHLSVEKGDVSILKELLKSSRRSAEIVDKDGRHALHLAVEKGDVSIVKELLKSMSRRSLEIVDKDGRNALHLAVEKGDVNTVKQLLKFMQGWIIQIRRADEHAEWTLVDYNGTQVVRTAKTLSQPAIPDANEQSSSQAKEQLESEQVNALSVMSVLIATLSFQALIQPPGGLKEETGLPVLADKSAFKHFMVANALAFFLSMFAAISLIIAVLFPRTFIPKSLVHLLTILARKYIGGVFYLVDASLWCMIICFIMAGFCYGIQYSVFGPALWCMVGCFWTIFLCIPSVVSLYKNWEEVQQIYKKTY